MDSMSRMPTGAPNIFARRSATIDVNRQILAPDCTLLNPLISVPTLPHSHSIVLSDDNALDFQRKFFLPPTQNRLAVPSKICAPDFKRGFRRFAISSVSATIGIDRSIFDRHCNYLPSAPQRENTVSQESLREPPRQSSR
jgi:hypothetical protein